MLELKIYSRLFLYLVLFNTVFILATFVLHESGHFIVGTQVFGCRGSIMLYDMQNQGPYTLLDCDQQIDKAVLYLSSLTFMVPFSLMFLLLRGFEERHFFLVILGIAVMSTAFDIEGVAGDEIARYTTIFAGMMIFIAGEYVVVEHMFNRFKDRIYLIHSGRTDVDDTANGVGADTRGDGDLDNHDIGDIHHKGAPEDEPDKPG